MGTPTRAHTHTETQTNEVNMVEDSVRLFNVSFMNSRQNTSQDDTEFRGVWDV